MISNAVLADSLQNLVSGLGTAKDKTSFGRFNQRQQLSRYEIEAIYRHNWIGGKVVDTPADDATRMWRQWNAPKAAVQAIEETEKRLKLRHAINLGLKYASRDGGAALIIGTADDPMMPLVPDRIAKGGLLYVHVVLRWNISVGQLDLDPVSRNFGYPTEWRIFLPNGQDVALHPSRVIPIIVTTRPEVGLNCEPWGDSIYERLRDEVRNATAGMQGAASMMQEAKIDVIKVPGLTKNVVNERYREAVLARFGLANTLKAINNALLLDADEEWDQKALTFAGYPEMIDRMLQVVAGAADMPVTRLLGRAPAGLNATGDADLESYYTMIGSRQETVLRPMLEPLDTMVVRSALGRTPRGTGYDWRPLWSLSAKDEADVRLKHAQSVKAYAETKLFDHISLAKAVATQLEEDGYLPGLVPAPEPELGDPNNPDDPGTPGQPNRSPRSERVASRAARQEPAT